MGNVRISDIAKFLGTTFCGNDGIIEGVCPLDDIKPHSMLFMLKPDDMQETDAINAYDDILVLATNLFQRVLKPSRIWTKNPKLDFARAFAKFFPPGQWELVKGSECWFEPGVKIWNTVLGNNCYIKSNAVIGQKGFSFIRDENGVPFPMPHKGKVIIGDNVEIGACTTVVRGVLSDTVIGNNVKIDDHVHIAHNVTIGDNTMIAACTEISGSVKIGKNVWIGPNCSILNHVEIGDGAFINISSTVVKDYKPNPKEKT